MITRQWEYFHMIWLLAVPSAGHTYHRTSQLIHELYPGWDKSNMPNLLCNIMPASDISWELIALHGAEIPVL